MKFEHRYPSATFQERFEFEYSYVTKSPKLGQCYWCGSHTRWQDIMSQLHVCSDECNGAMWKKYRDDPKNKSAHQTLENHFVHVKRELEIADSARPVWKDIIVIAHNQLDYLKICIESLRETTKLFHLYLWDNASDEKTESYINNLVASYDPNVDKDWSITTMRSDQNLGFIGPNNELAAWGDSEYIILLNSDTKVFANWDRAMTGFLEAHPDVGQIGYWGGHMGPDGRGFGGCSGYEIDYIPGWCFCISRATYDKFGLFDSQLKFAYCEDADFSLRLKKSQKRLYALHAPLVHHFQNKTIEEVERKGEIDVRATFEHNHQHLRQRWADYLATERVMVQRRKESHAPDLCNSV